MVLFTRNTILFTVIDDKSHENRIYEIVSFRKGQELLIGLVHLILNHEVNEVLLCGLNTWSSSIRVLVLGDFNANTVDWSNLRIEWSENSFGLKLVNTIITFYLVQHVKKATRSN